MIKRGYNRLGTPSNHQISGRGQSPPDEIAILPDITEEIKPPVEEIIGEKDLDVLAGDDNFLYTYSPTLLPGWLSDSFGLKPFIPNESKDEINQEVQKKLECTGYLVLRNIYLTREKEALILECELPPENLIIEKDGITTSISAIPFRRYIDILEGDKWRSVDLWTLIKDLNFLNGVEAIKRTYEFYNTALRRQFPEPGSYIQ